MKTNWIVKIMKYGVLGVAGVTAFGYLMMILWNWLMPPIFGWRTIGFRQALGLFCFFNILFGGCKHQGEQLCRSRHANAGSGHDISGNKEKGPPEPAVQG